MLKKIRENTLKIEEYADEIIACLNEKKKLILKLEKLDSLYQKKKFGYIEYEKIRSNILKGKTREYWLDYYNSYIKSLVGELLYHNKQILREVYND